MLRIPIRFYREFWTGKRISCEYDYIKHSWCIVDNGGRFNPLNIPDINAEVDMFTLVSDSRRHKEALRRWVRRERRIPDDTVCRNKIAFLHYAFTDGQRVCPLWNVWGGTIHYEDLHYNNRQSNLTVRSDGRIVNETDALNPWELSSEEFDQMYLTGNVWVSLYDTRLYDGQTYFRVRRVSHPSPEERMIPGRYHQISTSVLFMREGHLYNGTLLLSFVTREPRVSYSLAVYNTTKKDWSLYKDKIPWKTRIGPWPWESVAEVYGLIQQVLYKCLVDGKPL